MGIPARTAAIAQAEQLYVGLSRARSLPVMVGDCGPLEEVGGRDLKRAGMEAVLTDG